MRRLTQRPALTIPAAIRSARPATRENRRNCFVQTPSRAKWHQRAENTIEVAFAVSLGAQVPARRCRNRDFDQWMTNAACGVAVCIDRSHEHRILRARLRWLNAMIHDVQAVAASWRRDVRDLWKHASELVHWHERAAARDGNRAGRRRFTVLDPAQQAKQTGRAVQRIGDRIVRQLRDRGGCGGAVACGTPAVR